MNDGTDLMRIRAGVREEVGYSDASDASKNFYLVEYLDTLVSDVLPNGRQRS